jgi:hypothetical protein
MERRDSVMKKKTTEGKQMNVKGEEDRFPCGDHRRITGQMPDGCGIEGGRKEEEELGTKHEGKKRKRIWVWWAPKREENNKPASAEAGPCEKHNTDRGVR